MTWTDENCGNVLTSWRYDADATSIKLARIDHVEVQKRDETGGRCALTYVASTAVDRFEVQMEINDGVATGKGMYICNRPGEECTNNFTFTGRGAAR